MLILQLGQERKVQNLMTKIRESSEDEGRSIFHMISWTFENYIFREPMVITHFVGGKIGKEEIQGMK